MFPLFRCSLFRSPLYWVKHESTNDFVRVCQLLCMTTTVHDCTFFDIKCPCRLAIKHYQLQICNFEAYVMNITTTNENTDTSSTCCNCRWRVSCYEIVVSHREELQRRPTLLSISFTFKSCKTMKIRWISSSFSKKLEKI